MLNAKEILEAISVFAKLNNEFRDIEREIASYNRADTVNMTPDEMNKFRHIAASAYFVSKGYPEAVVNLLGHGKELKDIFTHINWADRSFDLRNNEIGRNIGRQFKYHNKKEIFDYIFVTEIKPKRR